MNTLHRVGLATARHPWRTIAAWLLVLVSLGGLTMAFGGELQDNWNVPDTRAQAGIDELREHFPDAGGSSAQVVLHDDQRLDRGVVDGVESRLERTEHVVSVTPRISEDGDTALLYVRYDVPTTHADIYADVAPLEEAAEPAEDAGYQVELGGELPGTATELEGRGELIGILVALALLVIAFGSVVAAGLPVATAAGGLVAGSSGVMLLAGVMDVSTSAPTIATMVGLGVGIDYALLIVTRHVERLRAGDSPVEAAARATATAGRSVVGAGLTVLVSLMGLRLAGLPTYDAFGFATAIVVVCVMAAALTLVPALCAMAGTRLVPRRERRGREARGLDTPSLVPRDGYSTNLGSSVVPGDGYSTSLGSSVVSGDGYSTSLGSSVVPGDGYSTSLGSSVVSGDGYSTSLGSSVVPGDGYSTNLGSSVVPRDGYSTNLGSSVVAGVSRLGP